MKEKLLALAIGIAICLSSVCAQEIIQPADLENENSLDPASSRSSGDTEYVSANGRASTDAAVTNIYTLGSIPVSHGNGHRVKARVENTGGMPITNLQVTLSVTGANPFNNVQTIENLPVGASAIVTFAEMLFNNTGNNTMSVSIPPDANPSNNTQWVYPTVTTNFLSYAYSGSSDGGVGANNSTIEMAAKFTISGAATITQVRTSFISSGNSFRIKIYHPDESGMPGDLLFNSPIQQSSTNAITFTLNTPVGISGDFFVAIEQVGTTNLGLRYQREEPLRSERFYIKFPNSDWQDQSSNPNNTFRPMFSVFLGNCVPPPNPSAISGPAEVCQRVSETFSVPSVPGATSYLWTLPSNWTGSSISNTISVIPGSTSGDIGVQAINGCGQSMNRIRNVTVKPTPPEPVITDYWTELSSSYLIGNQWYLNGEKIPDATSRTYTPTENGDYTVAVTHENECEVFSDVYSLMNVSVAELSKNTDLLVYPNPSKGIVNISFKNINPVNDLIISDMLGKIVKQIPLEEVISSAHNISFNGKDLGEGLYFIKIETGDKIITKKIMIKP